MDELINAVLKIIATLIGLGLIYVGKLAVAWLKSKLSAQNASKLDKFVEQLVAAAEQMYKNEDKDGSVRLEYVQTMLVEAGYDITEAVRALIEAKVFDINNIGGADNG